MAFKVIHLSIVFKFGHTFCSNNLQKKKDPKNQHKSRKWKSWATLSREQIEPVCVLFMQLYVSVCPDNALSLQISNQGQLSTSMEIDILSTQDVN